jgi:hypothetical protein
MKGTGSGPPWVDAASVAGIGFDELLALEGFPDASGAAVYLSGSLVSGTGNSWSDVDVFVIGTRDPIGPFAKSAATNRTSQHYVGSRRVDFEFWRPEQVGSLADRLAGFEPGSGRDINGTLFLPIEECFIHRLRIGIALANPDAVLRHRAMFDYDRFRAYQVERTIRTLDELLEDVCGMVEGDDPHVALFAAREVVGTAVAAYVHMQGNTDPTRKWLAHHLAALDDGSPRHREVTNAFWRLQFPDAAALRAEGGAWRAYSEECARFANRIVGWAQR